MTDSTTPVGHMFWWEQPQRSAALVRASVLDQ